MAYTIALMEGDGLGPVFCDRAEQIFEAIGNRFGFTIRCTRLPFGKSALDQYGSALPDQTITGIQEADGAVFFGVDLEHITGPSPVGALRKKLKLTAEVREVQSLPSGWCFRPDIRIAFVREISQGFLSDRNLYDGCGEWMTDENTAMSLRVITYDASRSIARRAFRYAEQEHIDHVTAIHKVGIFKKTCGMFLSACRDEAAYWPNIRYDEKAADDAAAQIISDPTFFGVVVTTNMFGDILSDEAAALVSGRCVGANYGENAAVYMSVHHGADWAELEADRYDPVPRLLCLVQILKDLGQHDAAAFLRQAVLDCARDSTKTGTAFFRELFLQIQER